MNIKIFMIIFSLSFSSQAIHAQSCADLFSSSQQNHPSQKDMATAAAAKAESEQKSSENASLLESREDWRKLDEELREGIIMEDASFPDSLGLQFTSADIYNIDDIEKYSLSEELISKIHRFSNSLEPADQSSPYGTIGGIKVSLSLVTLSDSTVVGVSIDLTQEGANIENVAEDESHSFDSEEEAVAAGATPGFRWGATGHFQWDGQELTPVGEEPNYLEYDH